MISQLNDRQQLFVANYLRTFNATQAALDAGYSPKTAYSQGHRLLKNAEIADAIQAFLNANAMSAAEVISHLSDIARIDIGDVLDENGVPDIKQARKRGKSNLIRKVKKKTTRFAGANGQDTEILEDEIEMYDRLQALNLLAKYHNLVNTVRVEDWRSQAIQDIRDGKITYDALEQAFDTDLATELFRTAGVPVQVGESAESK